MIYNDKENHQGAIWSNDGTKFEVIDEDKFVTHIVKNLPHTKAKDFSNFKRYLRNYNFTSKKVSLFGCIQYVVCYFYDYILSQNMQNHL